jgi:hypothetical protein
MSNGAALLRAEDHLDWSHEIVLNTEPPVALARFFVCHHLVGHGLFHLVDVVRVTAGEFAVNAVMRANPPLTLSLALSRVRRLVLLRIDAGSGEGPVTDRPLDDRDPVGSRAVGLLSTDAGLRFAGDDVVGMWATFDTRRRRHALTSAGRALTRKRSSIPKARGPSSSG